MRQILHIIFASLCLVASGQTITFDTDDYKAIGVYDTWAESPFRTGKLSGNTAVLDNHLTAVDAQLGVVPNGSAKIVGLQRSRYGSNTFGLRVDLKESFRLTKEKRYVHFLIHKPVESRVLVGGLGQRTEEAWEWQDGSCEQFLVATPDAVAANKWVEVVLPINGFSYAQKDKGGIDIHSLIICPDLRSPQVGEKDFACYIDQIEINDNPQPQLVASTSGIGGDSSAEGTPQQTRVSQGSLNGQVLTADGQPINNLVVPYGHPLTIKIDPYPGFTHQGVIIKTTGPNAQQQTFRHTAQEFDSHGLLTIPATEMQGTEVYIEGQFVEKR